MTGLDWTIVRPAAFTDDAETGSYLHGRLPEGLPLSLKIPRADVVAFMVKQVSDLSYLHKAPAVSQ